MARRGDPDELAPTVTLLRALRGWTKKQLSDASGVARSQISRYELGRETPSQRTLERLATAVGLPPFLLAPTTAFIRRLREAMAGGTAPGAAPADSAGVRPETKRAVLEALDRAAAQARAELKLHAASRAALAGSSESDPVP